KIASSTRSRTMWRRSASICWCASLGSVAAASIRSSSAIEGTAVRDPDTSLRRIPSVDEVLKASPALAAIDQFGRPAVVTAIRGHLDRIRQTLASGGALTLTVDEIAITAAERLAADATLKARPVFNLTGTVLHTNLGRALLADVAIAAATDAM